MSLVRRIRELARPRLGRRRGFRPYLPTKVDRRRLRADAAELLGVEPRRIERLYRDYEALHRERGHAGRLGERKTLNFEEAFLLFAVLATYRPEGPLVEIGTQYGKSTRRLLDMRERLGLEGEVVCFDVEDRVEHFGEREARLVLEDVTGTFVEDVLVGLEPALVYLDAHPHALLEAVIRGVLEKGGRTVLAIHDCSRGLCNPVMEVSKEDPEVKSATGHWERHVLAEVFGIADPLDPRLDRLETETHRLRIFGTTHGLALLLPRGLRDPSAGPVEERAAP